MTGDELARLLESDGVAVLDVRTRSEYDGESGYPCDPRQGHIPGAIHVPWEEIVEVASAGGAGVRGLLADRGVDTGRKLVAYCHSGQRSSFATTALRSAGLDAENYEGSWHEWSRRNEPVERSRDASATGSGTAEGP